MTLGPVLCVGASLEHDKLSRQHIVSAPVFYTVDLSTLVGDIELVLLESKFLLVVDYEWTIEASL